MSVQGGNPHVLVLNAGSSSLKYQLLDMERRERVAGGVVERIGEPQGRLTHRGPGGSHERQTPIPDHEAAVRAMLTAFDVAGPALADVSLVAVGHRAVHGGSKFSAPVVIDAEVEKAIEELSVLAPLHNPANLEGIRAARRAFGGIPHVAIFDTAFHQTLPPEAYTYAVPADWRDRLGIRRYGFHGTSHAYVSRTAAGMLGRPPAEVNLIVAHLGNGASITAVRGGASVDTSMGFTPLEGLVMGTRSGDLDPAIIPYLARVTGQTVEQIDAALNHDSGLKGLAGVNDLRDLWAKVESGDEAARRAIGVYCYRIRKYVGAYYAALGTVDAVVFTAGVGENDDEVRYRSLAGLERLGIRLDRERNAGRIKEPKVVSAADSEVAVLVVPTDEELEIATQSMAAAALAS